MHPYILNVNEDAQLSGVVKLFIQEGTCISSLRPQGFYLFKNCTLTVTELLRQLCVCTDLYYKTHMYIKHIHAYVLGEWVIGLCDGSPTSIPIKGLG